MLVDEQRRLLRRLLARVDRDEFAERVLSSYRDQQEPSHQDEPRRHAHMWVRWNLDLVLRWLVDGRPATESELGVLRRRASAQAHAGVPADRVPRNFRRAARFAWNAALELADEEERVAVLEVADWLFEYVDRVSRIYADAHAEAERSAPVAAEERLARGLLARLGADELPSAEDAALATRLGCRLEGTFRPLIVALDQAPSVDHLKLAERLRSEGLLAVSEGRWATVIVPAWPRQPEPAFAPSAIIARGELTAREGLGPTLAELRLLVDVAQSHGHRGVVDPNRYLPELLLRQSPGVAARIRQRVYGPLRPNQELGRTLDALVRHNFNQQAAAAELPVHRNTLRDRLSRIRELTALDLELPDDRGIAWLAHLCAPDPAQEAQRAADVEAELRPTPRRPAIPR